MQYSTLSIKLRKFEHILCIKMSDHLIIPELFIALNVIYLFKCTCLKKTIELKLILA